ncbi:acetyl-CoA carboxylase, carboxyltransferase subunit beta [Cohaesibacter celericrescens]|uniref:Acetyl-coenzyme A carboxylase carboxyl transferase subunit beta n=1 Tax=Cohaesibacter celericrescens TaxID=2067669 RepID=A0A2N5XN21_9HYPH|nr:acetyl-CoA carboxylase, carboxyltransferase subunit beta [Cohaesibacter celericrescens]PLW75892.1 acetyl-CoA carboxylase carboxyl transferase subunit beta [Cohaesibacter celericrescens]
MNWINTVVRPKIRSFLNRRDSPENLWIKCPVSGEMVFHRDLENNQYVVPNSNFHMRINATQRFSYFFDDNDYSLLELPEVAVDPLKFRDTKKYADRMKDARAKTGRRDSVVVAQGDVEGLFLTAAVQDFTFLGGSLGMAAAEALITGMMKAVEDKTPFVLFTASGGARMQEGILSLMQMPRTTVAVQALREAGLPYIVVLTDPTTGGVTASYAMLGDVQIAEPGALIGFAGQRVIEQTIREKLPEGFQRAEYLKEHGMVDMVVHRHELKAVIARLCRFFTNTDLPAPIKSENDNDSAEASAVADPDTIKAAVEDAPAKATESTPIAEAPDKAIGKDADSAVVVSDNKKKSG